MPKQDSANRYQQLIAEIFRRHYEPGMREFRFDRDEVKAIANDLALTLPSNIGDVFYTFRYRASLPESIRATAGAGEQWIIRSTGRGKYKFVLARELVIAPSPSLVTTKIPDNTPGLISMYALSDEQALLAVLRYNRMIDVFTGLTCYSLQSHLRTTVKGMGQVETDEVYVGLDRSGAHYVVPVQAKGRNDRIGQVQIEQDIAMCAEKFPDLVCRPIAAQFLADRTSEDPEYVIALFELQETGEGIRIAGEKHYQLVPPDSLTQADLLSYRQHP